MQLNDCALKSTAQEIQCCRPSVASLKTDLAITPLRVSNQIKIVSLEEMYKIVPHAFFTHPNILQHISLMDRANCLQFGMHTVHNHMGFVTKFGSNRLC